MKLVKLLSAFFLFLFIVNVNAAIAQAGGTDSRPEDVLRSEETSFFEHGENLSDFHMGLNSSDEREAMIHLRSVAEQATVLLHSLNTLMKIYDGLSNPHDRAYAGSLIQRDLSLYRADIGGLVKEISMAQSKKTDVTTEATQMRDDLHRVEDALRALKEGYFGGAQ